MSEYQYYEFLAVDRPLDERQQAEVRALSTPGQDHRHQLALGADLAGRSRLGQSVPDSTLPSAHTHEIRRSGWRRVQARTDPRPRR
jgi:hypothetical protein